MTNSRDRRSFFRKLLAASAVAGITGSSRRATAATGADGNYDVIVCGGGPGGVCAAVAAARAGSKVLLIEQYGFLGGMATAGLVEPFMPYETGGKRINAGLFTEVCNLLTKNGGFGSTLHKSATDSEVLKLVELDMCTQAGVELLFHSFVFGATVRKNRVTEIRVANKAGEMKFTAEVFIDATGDGDLAYHAGADWELGRDEDGLTQPSTMFFKMGGVDEKKYVKAVRSGKYKKNFKDITEKARALGEFPSPRENTLIFQTPQPGTFAFNTTRLVRFDATNPRDLTQMEIEGTHQAHGVAAYARKYLPGFEKSYLTQVAANVGVRESRRVVCDHKITTEDLLECREFDDTVARGCYPIDIHSPTGAGTKIIHLEDGQSYCIPYRSMTVKGFGNLLMGCRAIWGTHEAHSAYRVQPIVMCIGEAAGVAASMAVGRLGNIRDIDVAALRSELASRKAVL
jgi:hypothetical protein